MDYARILLATLTKRQEAIFQDQLHKNDGNMAKRKARGRDINGFIILDKPQGLSSNAALQRVKRIFNAAKAGHTGSLDPLATGVLPVCLGEATKFSQYLLDADKTYVTDARLGIKTTTGDSEGEILTEKPVHVKQADFLQIISEFTGNISQTPPMYSALKHKGQPLYVLARKGMEVERKSRNVTIKYLSLDKWHAPLATLTVTCTKGTYIRSLIEDMGEKLGCSAHVAALRRTGAGPYEESKSYTLDALDQIYQKGGFDALDTLLQPMDSALPGMPELILEEASALSLQQGKVIQVDNTPASDLVRIYQNKHFLGIGKVLENGCIAPKRLIKMASGLTDHA